jgi:hypothetical protein
VHSEQHGGHGDPQQLAEVIRPAVNEKLRPAVRTARISNLRKSVRAEDLNMILVLLLGIGNSISDRSKS